MQFSQNNKATPGQIESLVRAIGRTSEISMIFDNYEETAYDALSGITAKQCSYFNFLAVTGKGRELKRILIERGLKLIS